MSASSSGALDAACSALQQEFRRAGCDGFLCVRDLDSDVELGLDLDRLVVLASTFKIAVALEFFLQVAAGEIDPTERVHLQSADRTDGPTGLSLFADAADVSLRDLALSMMVVSDNAATDLLIRRVGLERINTTLGSLSLASTRIVSDLRTLLDEIGADLGVGDWVGFSKLSLHDMTDEEASAFRSKLRAIRALTPSETIRSTPREMVALVTAIWRNEAGTPDACANVRRLMGQTRGRVGSSFASDVRVSVKGGGLIGAVRNEVGVVEYPRGPRYAFAIFTEPHVPYEKTQAIDLAIGQAGWMAVEHLRLAATS